MCAVLIFAAFPVCVQALDSGVTSASVDEIKHHQPTTIDGDHSDKPLKINITVPKVYQGATVMAAFYTDGILTGLKEVSISPSTKEATVTFDLKQPNSEEGSPTPDSIKIFTWEQGKIKPLANSHEVLTTQVISAANAKIVSNILDYIIGTANKKSITAYVRNNINFEAQHDKILALMDKMDECARIANQQKETHLLTSEYAIRIFYDDVVAAFESIKDDPVQSDEFLRMYTNLNSGYESTVKKVFDRLAYLLCLDIEGFIKQK